MAAQPRYDCPTPARERVSVAPPSLAPADSRHGPVASPAAVLQARLDAALTTGAWARTDGERTDRWPGAVRVAVLVGGAVGSWALVWQAARLAL